MRKCIFIILLVIATCLLYAEGDYKGGKYGWVSDHLHTGDCLFTERLHQLPRIGLPRLFTPEDIILIEFDFLPICPF